MTQGSQAKGTLKIKAGNNEVVGVVGWYQIVKDLTHNVLSNLDFNLSILKIFKIFESHLVLKSCILV